MAIRNFRDSGGISWRVWHVVPQNEVLRTTTPALARGWLCFEAAGEKRRLADPPEGWAAHTDAELEALLLRAAAVRAAQKRTAEPA